jgi:hypothetical protein
MERLIIEGDKRLFEVNEGLSLELRRVSNFKVTQFHRAWKRHNPPPEVPLTEVKIAGKPVARLDYNDLGYRLARNEYDSNLQLVEYQYIITEGVINDPPADFKPDERLIIDGSAGELKMLWLYEQIEGDDARLNAIVEAISSLGEATQAAVEDAEKNLEPES